jgi:hypothetical protein
MVSGRNSNVKSFGYKSIGLFINLNSIVSTYHEFDE